MTLKGGGHSIAIKKRTFSHVVPSNCLLACLLACSFTWQWAFVHYSCFQSVCSSRKDCRSNKLFSHTFHLIVMNKNDVLATHKFFLAFTLRHFYWILEVIDVPWESKSSFHFLIFLPCGISWDYNSRREHQRSMSQADHQSFVFRLEQLAYVQYSQTC